MSAARCEGLPTRITQNRLRPRVFGAAEERDVINRAMRNGHAQVPSVRYAMDRLLERSFTPIGRGFAGENHQAVPVNLWEDENTYYLHIQAPSLDLASVDITVLGGMLTVSGQTAKALPEGTKSIWQE